MARVSKKEVYRQQRLDRLRKIYPIIAAGKCPRCGSGFHRNIAINGWIQCDRFGAPGFQKVAGPACDWQEVFDPTPEEYRQLNEEQAAVCSRTLAATTATT